MLQREEFQKLRSGINNMAGHLKTMPMPVDVLKGGETAITAWVTEKMTADPQFMTKFQADMATWEKQMDALGSKMENIDHAIFKKYGIDVPHA